MKYNPDVVSLEFLLQMFFKAIDPTSLNKQGHDEGTRYRTGIYYTDSEDLSVIEKVFAEERKNYQQPLKTFYFHCALEGDKLDCIADNPTVALSAVTKCAPTVGPKDGSFTFQYKSAMAVGKAEMVTDRNVI